MVIWKQTTWDGLLMSSFPQETGTRKQVCLRGYQRSEIMISPSFLQEGFPLIMDQSRTGHTIALNQGRKGQLKGRSYNSCYNQPLETAGSHSFFMLGPLNEEGKPLFVSSFSLSRTTLLGQWYKTVNIYRSTNHVHRYVALNHRTWKTVQREQTFDIYLSSARLNEWQNGSSRERPYFI